MGENKVVVHHQKPTVWLQSKRVKSLTKDLQAQRRNSAKMQHGLKSLRLLMQLMLTYACTTCLRVKRITTMVTVFGQCHLLKLKWTFLPEKNTLIGQMFFMMEDSPHPHSLTLV